MRNLFSIISENIERDSQASDSLSLTPDFPIFAAPMNLKEHITHPVFAEIGAAGKDAGHKCYVIGGYVRDIILNRTHSNDIDIVVEGKGLEVAKQFAKRMGSRDVVIFENFGTAMVKTPDYEVEFVGARKESYERNSRKPIVEEGSLRDDQLRRDFTINALSISLQKSDWGELYDPFEGMEDMMSQLIKTPTDPDITFSDDPLRMLRAVRFATQLGFDIEEKTFQSLSENKERLEIVSAERITTELNKIMMAKVPSRGFKILEVTGLLELILPELSAMKGVEHVNGRGHKDNFYHTLQVLDNVAEKSDNLWLRWVAILHDIAKPLTKRYDTQTGWTFHGHEDRGARMVPQIFRRLKLPLNDHMKYVRKLVQLHQRPIALVTEVVSDSAIRRIVFDAGEDLEDLLDFCRADITSKNEKKVKRFLQNYEELEKRIYEVEERDRVRNWQPPVTGEMIMEAFNLRPSKVIGLIKTEIREAIMEGLIPNSPEAAIAFMHEIAPKYLEE